MISRSFFTSILITYKLTFCNTYFLLTHPPELIGCVKNTCFAPKRKLQKKSRSFSQGCRIRR